MFICLPSIISAQVPGYMGKRFSVGYSNLFSPDITNLLSADNVKAGRLNISHSLDLNYVFNYRKALCLSVSYIEKKGDYTHSSNYRYYNPEDYTFNNREEKLSSIGISLGLKLFKRSRLAPLGPYVKWEALYLVDYQKVLYRNDINNLS